jgi:hypothetical protein
MQNKKVRGSTGLRRNGRGNVFEGIDDCHMMLLSLDYEHSLMQTNEKTSDNKPQEISFNINFDKSSKQIMSLKGNDLKCILDELVDELDELFGQDDAKKTEAMIKRRKPKPNEKTKI